MDQSQKRPNGQVKYPKGFFAKIWYTTSGLILDERTGKVVGSKLAATTGHATLAFWFSWLTYHNGFIEMMWWIYPAIFTGHKIFEKLIGAKFYGSKDTSNFNMDIPDQDDPDRPVRRYDSSDNRQAYMGRSRG